MAAKLETLQIRLSPDVLDWIDRYRARQPAVPSRAETLRWLIGIGVVTCATSQNPAPRCVRLNDMEER